MHLCAGQVFFVIGVNRFYNYIQFILWKSKYILSDEQNLVIDFHIVKNVLHVI